MTSNHLIEFAWDLLTVTKPFFGSLYPILWHVKTFVSDKK